MGQKWKYSTSLIRTYDTNRSRTALKFCTKDCRCLCASIQEARLHSFNFGLSRSGSCWAHTLSMSARRFKSTYSLSWMTSCMQRRWRLGNCLNSKITLRNWQLHPLFSSVLSNFRYIHEYLWNHRSFSRALRTNKNRLLPRGLNDDRPPSRSPVVGNVLTSPTEHARPLLTAAGWTENRTNKQR